MVPNARVMVVIGFLTISLLPFTNCGQYAQVANSSSESSAEFVPCNDICVTPVIENLSVKVNMGASTNYSVPANLTEFNLGGDCNEGGFPVNSIRWELQLNGATVRHSGMLGMAASGPAHSRCVNGRFLLYVNLSSINEDPVDRTGLKINAAGTRSAYDLSLEIYGFESATDAIPKRNVLKGRTRIPLSAL